MSKEVPNYVVAREQRNYTLAASTGWAVVGLDHPSTVWMAILDDFKSNRFCQLPNPPYISLDISFNIQLYVNVSGLFFHFMLMYVVLPTYC